MAREWYCEVKGQLIGPLDPADLRRMAQSSELAPTDKVRRGDSGKWAEARKVKGLFDQPAEDDKKTNLPLSPLTHEPSSTPATANDDDIAAWIGPAPRTEPRAEGLIDSPESGRRAGTLWAPYGEPVRAASPAERTKRCPACGEEILEIAKKCRHCGEILDRSLRPEAASVTVPGGKLTRRPFGSGSAKTNGVAGCLTIFMVLACCGGIGQILSPGGGTPSVEQGQSGTAPPAAASGQTGAASRPTESEPSARSDAAIQSDERFGAKEAAKTFVKKHLNHPSSASFPWFSGDAQQANDGSWIVTGKVKAKNSFNLETTMDYVVRVQHVGDNWSLIDIGMDESRE